MTPLTSTNPAKNYEQLGEVQISSKNEIQQKVQAANQAKRTWKELGIEKRIEILTPLYQKFKDKADDFAQLITQEIGKPITQSQDEVDASLADIKWYLENGTKALKNEITHEDEKSLHQIVYEPYGTTAVITPWNYPLEMFVWGAFPNLIAGNTVVFKISEECPLTGKLIEEVMNSADLPEGVFCEIYGAGEVGQQLAESIVDLIWFTGSSGVGKKLYQIAAQKFIKVIIEAGGSSPAVVFEDSDLAKAIPELYSKRFANCGQICNATKRLIVHESIFDEVVDRLKKEVLTKKMGDPEDEQTNIGSLVAKRQLDLLEEQVADALEKGAQLITGGKKPEGLKGAFYEPTILTNISKQMRVWQEETFGPVLPIVSFKTEEEAIELANDTPYGLGAKVYSKDLERAKRVASKIDAGTVEINQASRWLHCNPFGGYKASGMGREHGLLGFRELSQVKVVSMEK